MDEALSNGLLPVNCRWVPERASASSEKARTGTTVSTRWTASPVIRWPVRLNGSVVPTGPERLARQGASRLTTGMLWSRTCSIWA